MWLQIYKYKKKNSKIPSENEEINIFVKRDREGMRLICIHVAA